MDPTFPRLEVKALGRTGLSVTPIGLGLAALGRPAYITLGRDEDLGDQRSVHAMETRCSEILDAAAESGIRYVDAARSYGYAERFLASWLQARGVTRGSVTVGSKWGYTYVGDWRIDAGVHEIKDHSLATLQRQLAESTALLGDHLALYQIHSATLESGVLDDPDVLAEVVRLRAEGLAIGLTTSGPRQAATIRRALEVEVDGTNPFDAVQATWNLLEPSAGAALAEAKDAGLAVLVKEAVANGRLTSRATGAAARILGPVADRHGVTPDAVAIAAALAQPWVDVVLSGAIAIEQLHSNLRAAHLRLDASDLAELGTIAEPADLYWAERSSLPWA